MKHPSATYPWLLTLAAAAMATVVQVACSEETGETNPGGGGGTTTSSTGGGTTSSSSSSSSTTSTTIECSAVYSEIPAGECDLLQQDCPVGLGCEPVKQGASFTTQCVSGAGLKGTGQECNPQGQECIAGLACVLGKCSPVCCGANDQPCQGGDCNVNVNMGDDLDPIIVTYCSFLQTCDLFDPTHCDSGALGNCYPYSDNGYAVCAPPSQNPPAGDGEFCNSLNSCDDNMACVSDPGECRYACLLSNWQNLNAGEGGCPAGQSCNASTFNIPDIGICRP